MSAEGHLPDKKVTTRSLLQMKEGGTRITALTAAWIGLTRSLIPKSITISIIQIIISWEWNKCLINFTRI